MGRLCHFYLARGHRVEAQGSRYTRGCSPDWLKSNTPACEAVQRQAEQDWDHR